MSPVPSALPVPGDAQVPVLHDRVEVGDLHPEALHEGEAFLQQPPAAGDHLVVSDTGLLGQIPQGQSLQAVEQYLLLLLLQPGGRTQVRVTHRARLATHRPRDNQYNNVHRHVGSRRAGRQGWQTLTGSCVWFVVGPPRPCSGGKSVVCWAHRWLGWRSDPSHAGWGWSGHWDKTPQVHHQWSGNLSHASTPGSPLGSPLVISFGPSKFSEQNKSIIRRKKFWNCCWT